MDDFDFDEDFPEDTVSKNENSFSKDSDESKPAYNNEKSNYTKNFSKKKKGIDLFNEDPTPAKIDFESMKVTKSFSIAVANEDLKLKDGDKEKIEKLLIAMKDKGYRVRLFCKSVNAVWETLEKIFEPEDITVVRPWKKFCDIDEDDYTVREPTDANKEAAAMYFKNFNRLPTAIKFINSGILNVLFCPKNNSAVEYVLVYDPYGTDREIDFKNSRGSATYRWFPKTLKEYSLQVFNLADEKDFKNFVYLIKDKKED